MIVKKTITLPTEMDVEGKKILNDPYSDIRYWNELLGLGIQVAKKNPNLVKRIGILETKLELLENKVKSLVNKNI